MMPRTNGALVFWRSNEENPYYDGNFEKVVLREERGKDALAKQ